MDKAWVEEVLAALGARYKLGPLSGAAVELFYRAGRAEFRPCRFMMGGGESGRDLEIVVDVRIPKDVDASAADKLVEAFDSKTAKPRGFVRVDDQRIEMTSEGGAASGSVRTMRYRRVDVPSRDAAREIRALVETIDIPIVVGIHEPEHVVAREAPPHRDRARHALAQLDDWEYTLDGGLLRSLSLVVNPNDRTLRVVERKLFSKRQLGDVVKLAHISRFIIKKKNGAAEVVAMKRDGVELPLATGSGSNDFLATAGRFAKKVMIPIEEGT